VQLPDFSGWPFWRGVLIGLVIFFTVKYIYLWLNP
jgi:hypothetical protein